MNNMNRAYEALIEHLDREMDILSQKLDGEIIAIDILLDFVLDRHGPKITKELAEVIEKKGGKDIVSFVNDKCYERGIDLVEVQK